MAILKILCLLLLASFSVCELLQADNYYLNNTICKSICDDIQKDQSQFASQIQEARDFVKVAIQSKSVIHIAHNMSAYSWAFKKMHLDNWQGVKLLRSYSDGLQKIYRKSRKDIIKYVYPDSIGCQPCPEETELTQESPQLVKPYPNLLLNETFKDTPQLQLLSKALIDLPIQFYPKWTSFNETLLTYETPQQRTCAVNQPSRAQQEQCLEDDHLMWQLQFENTNTGMFYTSLFHRIQGGEIHVGNFSSLQDQLNNGLSNRMVTFRFGDELLRIYQTCKSLDNLAVLDNTC